MSSVTVKRKAAARTRSAYQAHVSTFTTGDEASNVVDLAERKLRRLASRHADADVRKLATRMLSDYLKGSIAIAWENGVIPIYCFLKL